MTLDDARASAVRLWWFRGERMMLVASDAGIPCPAPMIEHVARPLAADAVILAALDEATRERDEARAVVLMLYDKWENGTPCHETDECGNGFGADLGNAFRLDEADENRALAVIEAHKPGSTILRPRKERNE